MPEKPMIIRGDVAATADVAVNTKGGSVSATLKKPLREKLGDISQGLAGAAVEFTTGQALLILGGAGDGETLPVRIQKVGRDRFEIELEGAEEEIDEVSAAFLRLKIDQFNKGFLQLSKPMTAEEWGERTSALDREESEVEEPDMSAA